MTVLLVVLCLLLLAIIAVQIGKVTELTAKIRGEEAMQETINKRQGVMFMVFMVVFLLATFISAYYYKNYMLGYGPHQAASEHGGSLDYAFNVTLLFTGIVFVITHILLFYYSYKYAGKRNGKAFYNPHDNRLERIWTGIPAIAMTFLVISGLDIWNRVMADIKPGDEYLEIEAMGYQFAWALRYPGPDGQLGSRDYKLVSGSNLMGQDWKDRKNIDDMHVDEIVLPVNKKVRVRITARDVLHDFFLPHFRVKMDAVPGIPTYFVFTPTKTTEQYRQELRKYKEYNIPADPADPKSPKLWEVFDYELACAELCGNGHYSMRRKVRIVSQDEYDTWLRQQKSFYMSSIRNTEADPFKDELLDVEISSRREEFNTALEAARLATEVEKKIVRFNYVNFETGSAKLTALSRYELNNVVDAMNKYPAMTVELAGHTDSTGDPAENITLSQNRAQAVFDYLLSKGVAGDRLVAKGYGQNVPVDSNDTDAGRANNRRTEMRITKQ